MVGRSLPEFRLASLRSPPGSSRALSHSRTASSATRALASIGESTSCSAHGCRSWSERGLCQTGLWKSGPCQPGLCQFGLCQRTPSLSPFGDRDRNRAQTIRGKVRGKIRGKIRGNPTGSAPVFSSGPQGRATTGRLPIARIIPPFEAVRARRNIPAFVFA